jgi:hypothetical protein
VEGIRKLKQLQRRETVARQLKLDGIAQEKEQEEKERTEREEAEAAEAEAEATAATATATAAAAAAAAAADHGDKELRRSASVPVPAMGAGSNRRKSVADISSTFLVVQAAKESWLGLLGGKTRYVWCTY